ncbi:hypothetical protein KIN20_007290 [Parelaphostrongylus tenuis]|uniref:Uncharacterized protein n=1 Tax=Parelaphostrongylus tenuis TaxID=148309 RepID=A0AAD5MPF0_PARTN|nr:hypothetical protein KIN20_007290 [Parelaphostrongylus tenuis]
MTVENARRINRWFSVTFRTSETSMKYRPDLCRFDAAARYSEMVAKKMFERDADRAALLFALFVSMGCTARICVNTLPTPRTWNERIANEVAKMRNSSASTFSTKHWKRGRRRRAGFKKKSTRANEYHGMARDYWVEYWDEKQNRWICVDPRSGTVDDPNIIEDYITKPVLHIFAIDIEGDVHEVTARYMSDFWRADLRRRRSESKCVKKNNMQTSRYLSEQENLELHEGLVKKSLPTTMAEFKNHPLYVLEKDLLKFEGIYPRPEDQKPLGEVCGHKVYSRSTVYILQSANNWIKMARNIKVEKKPYKVVKARPNIRVPAEERVQRHLDLFGYWQTEPYRPPKVINGRIPRNEFGNVYMYQPSMCPIGAVHLRLPGLPSIARRLGGLECVPAIVGWDFRSRSNFPIIDGVCVLEEVAEKFISEYRGLEEMRMERENKEREDRALGNWRRLARGVLRYLYTKSKFGAARVILEMVATRRSTREIPGLTAVEKGVEPILSPLPAEAKASSKVGKAGNSNTSFSGFKPGKVRQKSAEPKTKERSENVKEVRRRGEKIEIGNFSYSTRQPEKVVKSPSGIKTDSSPTEVEKDEEEDKWEDFGNTSEEDAAIVVSPSRKSKRRRSSKKALPKQEDIGISGEEVNSGAVISLPKKSRRRAGKETSHEQEDSRKIGEKEKISTVISPPKKSKRRGSEGALHKQVGFGKTMEEHGESSSFSPTRKSKRRSSKKVLYKCEDFGNSIEEATTSTVVSSPSKKSKRPVSKETFDKPKDFRDTSEQDSTSAVVSPPKKSRKRNSEEAFNKQEALGNTVEQGNTSAVISPSGKSTTPSNKETLHKRKDSEIINEKGNTSDVFSPPKSKRRLSKEALHEEEHFGNTSGEDDKTAVIPPPKKSKKRPVKKAFHEQKDIVKIGENNARTVSSTQVKSNVPASTEASHEEELFGNTSEEDNKQFEISPSQKTKRRSKKETTVHDKEDFGNTSEKDNTSAMISYLKKSKKRLSKEDLQEEEIFGNTSGERRSSKETVHDKEDFGNTGGKDNTSAIHSPSKKSMKRLSKEDLHEEEMFRNTSGEDEKAEIPSPKKSKRRSSKETVHDKEDFGSTGEKDNTSAIISPSKKSKKRISKEDVHEEEVFGNTSEEDEKKVEIPSPKKSKRRLSKDTVHDKEDCGNTGEKDSTSVIISPSKKSKGRLSKEDLHEEEVFRNTSEEDNTDAVISPPKKSKRRASEKASHKQEDLGNTSEEDSSRAVVRFQKKSKRRLGKKALREQEDNGNTSEDDSNAVISHPRKLSGSSTKKPSQDTEVRRSGRIVKKKIPKDNEDAIRSSISSSAPDDSDDYVAPKEDDSENDSEENSVETDEEWHGSDAKNSKSPAKKQKVSDSQKRSGNKQIKGSKTREKSQSKGCAKSRTGEGIDLKTAPITPAAARTYVSKPPKPWQKTSETIVESGIVVPPRMLRRGEKKMLKFRILAAALALGRIHEMTDPEASEILQQMRAVSEKKPTSSLLSSATQTSQELEEGESSEDEWEEMELADVGDSNAKNVQVMLEKSEEKDWWAIYLRQEVNKCVRYNWENSHKVNILCYIGHLQYLRKVMLEENLIPSLMLTRMPSGHQKLAEEPMTVENARRITRWFATTFKASETSVKYEPGLCRFDATSRYSEMVAQEVYENDADRAALLFALFVSMGCTARICVNTLLISRKWDENITNELAKMRESSVSPFVSNQMKQGGSGKTKSRKKNTTVNEHSGMVRNYWIEYWDKKQKKWICVDPLSATVDDPNVIEENITKPVMYIFAIDNEGGVREVTARYVSDFWRAEFRRRRTDPKWITSTLRKNFIRADRQRSEQEDLELRQELVKKIATDYDFGV